MIQQNKVIIMDIDGTLAFEKAENDTYLSIQPCQPVLARLLELKANGWRIVLYTSRSMRSYEANVGEIIAKTAPVLFEWLKLHQIPYDEIHFGKPWCGFDGFYVDDKAIRPREFATLSLPEIQELIEQGKF